jgi:hypothetical protein
MLSYYSLRRNECAFKQFTGITVSEFDALYADFEAAWVIAERKRLERPGRKRAVGGGNNYRLEPEEQLLMVMVWLRLYLTTAVVGYLFGISGKRRRSTCKSSLIVNEHGKIRAVTDTAPGRTHELTQIRQADVLDDIPICVGVVADAAYDGLYKDLPEHSVATTHKAQRNHPLEQAHKDINRELSSLRIIVENVICQLKHFRILADRFRHDVRNVHSDVFAVIAALINRRTQHRLESSHAT